MRLLINTASTLKGGGVQVAKSFIEEAVHFPEHEYHIVLGVSISKLINQKEYPPNFFFYTIPYRPATRVFSFQSTDIFFKDLEQKIRPDCVFTTSGPAYWRPHAPHLMGYNLPHYVYKDSPFFHTLSIYKRLYWRVKGLLIRYFVIRDADAYVVQTDDVNQRLKQWIGETNVYTVSNTCSEHYSNSLLPKPLKLPPRTEGEFRFLMLSAWYKHKNFEVINRIADLFRREKIDVIKFVLTLPSEVHDKMFTPVAKNYIHNIGPVKPEECPGLYQECDAIFLPTLLECFSATYAEAMIMNKPIITSDLGFAHTVCGEAALYIQPFDAVDIVEKIKLLANSKGLRDELTRNGKKRISMFPSARKRVEQYLLLCKSLVDG